MPVTVRKSQKVATLVCDICGAEGEFKVSSPAAPELTACEEAGKVGWGYSIGFFAMMAGHRVYCPDCIALCRDTGVSASDCVEG